MSKLISYQVPTAEKNSDTIVHETRHGVVVFLRIGTRRVKCVIQEQWIIPEDARSVEKSLVHYASGMVIASNGELRKQQHLFRLAHGPYSRMPWREAARLALEEKVTLRGIDRVLQIIDNAEVINS